METISNGWGLAPVQGKDMERTQLWVHTGGGHGGWCGRLQPHSSHIPDSSSLPYMDTDAACSHENTQTNTRRPVWGFSVMETVSNLAFRPSTAAGIVMEVSEVSRLSPESFAFRGQTRLWVALVVYLLSPFSVSPKFRRVFPRRSHLSFWRKETWASGTWARRGTSEAKKPSRPTQSWRRKLAWNKEKKLHKKSREVGANPASTP